MIKKSFNQFKYNKFNPSINEWLNSIYNFNKNNLNVIWKDKIIFSTLKSYFNMVPHNISYLKKIQTKFSLKRVFVSIPEIKNSINSINIFVYIFNKEKLIFNKKIIKLQKINLDNKLFKNKNLLTNKNFIINNKSSNRSFSTFLNKKNLMISKNISKSSKSFVYTIFKLYKNIILDNIKVNFNIIKYLDIKMYKEFFNNKVNTEMPNFIISKRNYKNNFISDSNFNETMKVKLINMRSIMNIKYYVLFFYKRYVTRLYFNKLKFNSINLFNINKLFYKIYNKRVNINIVNLKYLYLDNSLYIDAIVRKLKKRDRKVLKVLRKALILPKIPEISSMFLLRRKKEISNIVYNINLNNYIDIKNISKVVFESLKNTHVIGVRLEGKGRLTKRLTASRAVHKKTYIGSLKNVYSSFKGLSTLMTKGFNKSNLNYINLNSYNRNGSYGIKSWQNTM